MGSGLSKKAITDRVGGTTKVMRPDGAGGETVSHVEGATHAADRDVRAIRCPICGREALVTVPADWPPHLDLVVECDVKPPAMWIAIPRSEDPPPLVVTTEVPQPAPARTLAVADGGAAAESTG